jgi:hypothetical protein
MGYKKNLNLQITLLPTQSFIPCETPTYLKVKKMDRCIEVILVLAFLLSILSYLQNIGLSGHMETRSHSPFSPHFPPLTVFKNKISIG